MFTFTVQNPYGDMTHSMHTLYSCGATNYTSNNAVVTLCNRVVPNWPGNVTLPHNTHAQIAKASLLIVIPDNNHFN